MKKLLPLLLSPIGFANAVVLSSTPVGLYDIIPQNTQGTDGVSTQARLSASGAYADMSYNYNGIGDYSWFHQSSSPGYQIYRGNDETTTVAGPIATPNSVYAPGPTNTTFDKIIRVGLDFSPTFDSVQISGQALHFRISGASNVSNGVTAFIYKNEAGFGAPIWQGTWSTNDNTFRDIDITVPAGPGDELFFAVNNNGDRIADHFNWVDVEMTATSSVPEPSALALLGLAFFPLLSRRR